jgi:glutathione S-transferase
MVTLFQAEWCPYSSAVRERLTELGIDFVARQVEPREAERTVVREIPTLETEDGLRFEGTKTIFEFLSTLDAGAHERGHRAQYRAHAEARRRDVTARLLERVPLSSGS